MYRTLLVLVTLTLPVVHSLKRTFTPIKGSLIRTLTQALRERCKLRDFVCPENISVIVWVDNLVKDWLLFATFIYRRPVNYFLFTQLNNPPVVYERWIEIGGDFFLYEKARDFVRYSDDRWTFSWSVHSTGAVKDLSVVLTAHWFFLVHRATNHCVLCFYHLSSAWISKWWEGYTRQLRDRSC